MTGRRYNGSDPDIDRVAAAATAEEFGDAADWESAEQLAWKSAPVDDELLTRVLNAFHGRGLFIGTADAAHVARYITRGAEPNMLAEELAGVPGAESPRVELANIRRLAARHGIKPADGNGELRSTVAMVEEALIARPPVGTDNGGRG